MSCSSAPRQNASIEQSLRHVGAAIEIDIQLLAEGKNIVISIRISDHVHHELNLLERIFGARRGIEASRPKLRFAEGGDPIPKIAL